MSAPCEIKSFAERDIDVWLAEELLFNASFCNWFLDNSGVSTSVEVPAYRCRVSVTDETGRETDVEALFRASTGGVLALLIENKIKAPFQPNQMEDYIERGERGVQAKLWDNFSVVVFAPSYRILSVPESVKVIHFNNAANAMLAHSPDDRRFQYRSSFLQQANRPTAMVEDAIDPSVITWWYALDEMVRREFGGFFVLERKVFPKQTWVNPRCVDMAEYLRVDLKGAGGEVDLAFKNVPFAAFSKLVKALPDMSFILVENKKSSALRVAGLERFLVTDGLEIIPTRAYAAYSAAKRLLEFWRFHRDRFDSLAANAG